MKGTVVLFFTGLLVGPGSAFPEDKDKGGKNATEQSCQLCHSLRLVESQRLSALAWQKEVEKMIGWGATVTDRQTLVEYLSQRYSNTVPPPAPTMSGGSK